MKNGGIAIFVQQNIQYEPVDLDELCIDQIIEVCEVKLYLPTNNICIVTFLHFLNSLELILNRIYTKSIKIILCGDVNVNYLDDKSTSKTRLSLLLASYHLSSIIDFPTRVSNTSATAIDNVFINRSTKEKFSVNSLPNGFSDHDAQLLTLSNTAYLNSSSFSVIRRLINQQIIMEFTMNLSY
jgi:hypothetical protein